MKRPALWLVAVPWLALPAWAETQAPKGTSPVAKAVLVELFTSQG